MSASPTWIVPNRNTLGLIAVLVGMWWAGSSQNNAAAYLLGFMLAGVAIVSIAHAWANVASVVLEVDAIPPAFAGGNLAVPLRASTTRGRRRFAIRTRGEAGGKVVTFATIPATGDVTAALPVAALRRGVFAHLAIRIESHYPLGFFTARRTVRLAVPHCVYPAPVGSAPWPAAPVPSLPTRDGARTEGDDFGGVRAWRIGESQRHIDWKAAARGQPLLIKQWAGDGGEATIFEWNALPALATEARLSQLAQWIVQAERGGIQYGLQLPRVSVPLARGPTHYHSCLRHLAEFVSTEPSA